MDPNKKSAVQTILAIALKGILSLAHLCMKVFCRDSYHNLLTEPTHLEKPPDRPIDSLALFEALDPETPVKRLNRILDHEDHYIRRALARNPSLPLESLQTLISDNHPEVNKEATRIMELVKGLHKNIKAANISKESIGR